MKLLMPVVAVIFVASTLLGCKAKDPTEDVTEVKTSDHSRARGKAVTKVDIITNPPLNPKQIPSRGEEGADFECWWDIEGDMQFEYTTTRREGGGLFSSAKEVEENHRGLRGGDGPNRIKMETAHFTGYLNAQPPQHMIDAIVAVGKAQQSGQQPPADAINTLRRNQELYRTIIQKAGVIRFLQQGGFMRQLANNRAGEYFPELGANFFPMDMMITNRGRVFAGWRPLGQGDAYFAVIMGRMDNVGTFIKDRNMTIEFAQTRGSAGVLSIIPESDASWIIAGVGRATEDEKAISSMVKLRTCPEDFKKPTPGEVLPGEF